MPAGSLLSGQAATNAGGWRRSPGDRDLVGLPVAFDASYPDLTVEENVGFIGSLYGLSWVAAAQNAGELLAFAGLSARRSSLAGELSGGMKQKLTLVCGRDPYPLFPRSTIGPRPLQPGSARPGQPLARPASA